MRNRFVPLAILALSLGWEVQAQNMQQVIGGMQNRWAGIRDASAIIEIQTWDKAKGEEVTAFYGQIFYQAPRLIRLEYSPTPTSASESTLYPMGKNKYIYIHDGRELWRYSLSKDAWYNQFGDDPVISMVNQIADINNFNVDRFLQIYQVADIKSERLYGKIPTYLVRAEPKNKSGKHPRQLLWIGNRDYLPVEAIMARDESEVSCFFHKIKQNPGLPDEIFAFNKGS